MRTVGFRRLQETLRLGALTILAVIIVASVAARFAALGDSTEP